MTLRETTRLEVGSRAPVARGMGPGQVVPGPTACTWPSWSTWHPFDLSPWAVGIWGLTLGAQPSTRLYPDIPEHAVLLVLGQRG